MEASCDKLRDKILVENTGYYPYYQNGRQFTVHFEGVNYDPALLVVENVEDEPLQGSNITFNVNVTQAYGTNLYYEPVPFEFIKTYETKPQLIV